ncbi:MAG TPA: ComEA family DNA-binding protein [Bellilinea sp.]|nr:ComEA family DNA-binding protein [Bellilinea sp.]
MKYIRLIVIGLAFGILITSGFFIYRTPKFAETTTLLPTPSLRLINVTISGEVHNPGNFGIPLGSSLQTLIDSSGGLTGNADLSQIDPDQIVIDGQKYVINSAISRSLGISTNQININTASSTELESLPGIGPSLAGKIISYREAYGRFDTIEELDKVPGIGPSLIEKIKPFVIFE